MSWHASPAKKISRPFKISVVESPRRQQKSEASCPTVVAKVNVKPSVFLKNEPVNRTSHRCSFQHQENRNFLFGILRHLLVHSSALGGFFIYMSFRKFSKVATSKCKCKSKIERSKKAAKVKVNVKVKLKGVKGW